MAYPYGLTLRFSLSPPISPETGKMNLTPEGQALQDALVQVPARPIRAAIALTKKHDPTSLFVCDQFYSAWYAVGKHGIYSTVGNKCGCGLYATRYYDPICKHDWKPTSKSDWDECSLCSMVKPTQP